MPSSQYKIAETFHSIQGEGSWAGQQAFFIRFHGCNLTCDFGGGFACDDVAHTSKDFKMMTVMDMEIAARKIPNTLNIVITGGEVTLNSGIGKVINSLKLLGFHVAVETNGYKIERLSDADLITYSPKIAWSKVARLITYNDYLKIFEGGRPIIELKLLAGKSNEVDVKLWEDYPLKYIQAIGNKHGFDKTNMRYCVDFVTVNPEWYLSTQLQKLYKVD